MKESKIKQPECRVIKRSEINFASYNPRKISESARKKLKANLKRVGLLGGIVWNERTGNLVSGHQRVSLIDEVNQYYSLNNKNDYTLRVEVVDLDEKSEKEQNVFMNNRTVQGEFDDDMLREMISEIDFDLAGFSDLDIDMLGLSDVTDGLTEQLEDMQWNEEMAIQNNREYETIAIASKNTKEDKSVDRTKNFYEDTIENQIVRHNEIQKIKDRIKSQNDINKDNGMLSYVVLSFKSPTERLDFMEMFGYNLDDTYIDGKEFFERVEFGFPE